MISQFGLFRSLKLRASGGGLCYPPPTTAFGARRRIDFTVGLRWLLYYGIANAVTSWTFMDAPTCRA
jgi:hypothetical protein